MEVDEIMAKQLRQMEKERRDKETRLKAQEKKVWALFPGGHAHTPPHAHTPLASFPGLPPPHAHTPLASFPGLATDTPPPPPPPQSGVSQLMLSPRTTSSGSPPPHLQVDYFERAKRMCELPKLTVQYAHQRDQDHRFHDDQEEERVSPHPHTPTPAPSQLALHA